METEAEKSAKEALIKSLEDLSSFNFSEVEERYRNNYGQSIKVAKGTSSFERIVSLLDELKKQSFDNIPTSTLSKIQQLINPVSNLLERLYKYSDTTESTKQQTVDSLINEAEDWYNTNFPELYPLLAYLTQRGTDFKDLENQARMSVQIVEEEIGKLKTDLQKKSEYILSEASSALEKVKKVAGEAGVAQHNQNFKEEAENNDMKSTHWLIATVLMGVICISLSTWFVFDPRFLKVLENATIPQIAHLTVTKVFLISTLYYFLIFCAKNYRSHRHNGTINKHRCNALKTFEAFIKASDSDPDTKNAVLLQTTQSIFANQHTGYISHETDHEPNKIVEIIRSAAVTTGHK